PSLADADEVTTRLSPRSPNGEGGRRRTVTVPPPTATSTSSRAQPGSPARAATVAEPPEASARAPASAAPSASVRAYPPRRSWSATSAARSSAGSAATSSTDACPRSPAIGPQPRTCGDAQRGQGGQQAGDRDLDRDATGAAAAHPRAGAHQRRQRLPRGAG